MKKIKKRIKKFMQNSVILYGLMKKFVFAKRSHTFKSYSKHLALNEKTIMFEAFQGRKFACSPKAMYLAAIKDDRYKDFTFIWSLRDVKKHDFLLEEPRTEIIKYDSRSYLKAAATSKYWVTNSTMQPYLNPTQEQVFIQCWHGTPLKRLGCDLEFSPNKSQKLSEVKHQYRSQAKKITYFISPSQFYTEKIGSAYDIAPEMRAEKFIECGYPRNDFLFSFSKQDVIRVKKALNIPEGKKVLLYAPTFRDDTHERGKGFHYSVGIDFDVLYKQLSKDYVILFRAHYFIVNSFDFEKYGDFIIDVSSYDDINELYIVSDMLMTDYSSVFFDYANLKRPILFFMYDFEKYKGELRDFYLNMNELPGPIVYKSEDICPAVRQLEEVACDERYEKFNCRFNSLNDADSSLRALGECIK